MMEKHSDMIIYRPEPPGPPGDRNNDVTDPDQQRSVIKVFMEGFRILISYWFLDSSQS